MEWAFGNSAMSWNGPLASVLCCEMGLWHQCYVVKWAFAISAVLWNGPLSAAECMGGAAWEECLGNQLGYKNTGDKTFPSISFSSIPNKLCSVHFK